MLVFDLNQNLVRKIKRACLLMSLAYTGVPLNIRTSMERPLTVRPYLYGRYI